MYQRFIDIEAQDINPFGTWDKCESIAAYCVLPVGDNMPTTQPMFFSNKRKGHFLARILASTLLPFPNTLTPTSNGEIAQKADPKK